VPSVDVIVNDVPAFLAVTITGTAVVIVPSCCTVMNILLFAVTFDVFTVADPATKVTTPIVPLASTTASAPTEAPAVTDNELEVVLPETTMPAAEVVPVTVRPAPTVAPPAEIRESALTVPVVVRLPLPRKILAGLSEPATARLPPIDPLPVMVSVPPVILPVAATPAAEVVPLTVSPDATVAPPVEISDCPVIVPVVVRLPLPRLMLPGLKLPATARLPPTDALPVAVNAPPVILPVAAIPSAETVPVAVKPAPAVMPPEDINDAALCVPLVVILPATVAFVVTND